MKEIIIIIALALILGCSNDLSNSVQNTKDFDSFLEEAKIEKSGEMFIYDGDVAMSREHVRDIYNNYLNSDSRGNYSNPYMKWNETDRLNLTYQFTGLLQTSDLTDAQVRSAFREAAGKWMDVAGVKFTEVNSNPLFTVTGTLDFNADYYAISFFPYENTEGENDKVIILNRWRAAHKYYTYDRMVGLFTHELGHALGLAHEHQRDDSPYHFGDGYYSWFKHGSYDEDSVMNYVNRPYLSGISQGDIDAIQNLYPVEKYIVVYEHANYEGRSLKITQGNNNVNLHSIGWGDKISSIKCFNGAEVTVYQHITFDGESMTILKDVSNLHTYEFNDVVSSIKWYVPKDIFIIAYKHANFKGRAITITGSMAQLPLNDTMSSVEIYNGLCATLFQHSNYKGESLFIGRKTRAVYEYPGYTDRVWSDNYLENFNDIASSIRVR